jgi:sugar phosphate isomerase/epimerase
MARLLALQSAVWLDWPLEELAQKANEWGYTALELACAGDHFLPGRADSEPDYGQKLLTTLEQNELRLSALSVHGLGQVIGDELDARHEALVPDYVWGDGEPASVKARAAAELRTIFRLAQKLGVSLIVGSMGSPLTRWQFDDPPATPQQVQQALAAWAESWRPLLEAARQHGLRFALEARPGQIAYDLLSAERLLRAVDGMEALGFAFCPAHFHWQGLDPCEFARAFPDRLFQVTLRDAAVTLTGRNSILSAHLPPGDGRRGWSYRLVGRGGIDWEALVRTLNEIGCHVVWSVNAADPGMERDFAAAEAASFARRLDFPCMNGGDAAFGD